MMKRIYLDYAATTPIDPRIAEVIFKYSKSTSGNPSSIYFSGRKAKELLDDSRQKIANIIGSSREEIIFANSGTEANNLAILGAARSLKHKGRHILISNIEHLSVLRSAEILKKEGFEIEKIKVNKTGLLDLENIIKAIRKDTILISIIYANNEIGTIQSIAKISRAIKEFKRSYPGHKLPIFHTDACQAAGALDVNVQHLGVQMMTMNGSKIYGPKATGLLYIKRGLVLEPLIVGGSQERGIRAGTENPTLYAGLAMALEFADRDKEKESLRLKSLRDYLIDEIINKIPETILNGDSIRRLPNNINVSFAAIDGEMLMMALDEEGIEVSTGSACTSTSTEPSHVIKALGVTAKFAKGNIRITLGRHTSKKELEDFVKILTLTINRMRNL